MEDKIISALIGLVGACDNNPKTENTDRLVIKALATMQDANAAKDMIGEIREEKNRISPGCAVCKAPCGNTSDYDMRRIYNAKDEVRKTKLHIVSEIEETAEYVYRNTVPTSETETEFFIRRFRTSALIWKRTRCSRF